MRDSETIKLDREYQKALKDGTSSASSLAGFMGEKSLTQTKAKLSAYAERTREKMDEEKRNEPHTYAEITRAIPKALALVNRLKDEPDRLRKEKKIELNKKFDELVLDELFSESGRSHWLEAQMRIFFQSPEYEKAKKNLKNATDSYSKYLALKENWEKNNADIIEAERLRTRRMELMQADPETLKALGITPDPTIVTPKVGMGVDPKAEVDVGALLPKFMENNGYK